MPMRCPLYPQKRTSELSRVMSALCQKRTFCAAETTLLFDHLVGDGKDPGRNYKAKCLRSFEVDCHFKFGRLKDRQVCGPFAFQDPTGVNTDLAIASSKACSVTYQATSRDELALRVDRRDRIARSERHELITLR